MVEINEWDIGNGLIRFYIYKSGGGYLHQDNIWRSSTRNESSEYTGFFDTKKEAEIALFINISKNKETFAVLKVLYYLHGKDLDKAQKIIQEIT